MPGRRPCLALISLGGTIAMAQGEDGAGVRPALNSAALLDAIPALGDMAEIQAEDFATKASANLTFDDARAVAARIAALDAAAGSGGIDGIVVTQGTDTLADMAFLLAVILRPRCPVMLTGAMRHPAQPSADGPANLLAAARAALSPELAGLGPLVVMNDRVYDPKYLRKTDSSNIAAFASGIGPLAVIVESQVRLLARPAPLPHIPHDTISAAPRVAMVIAAFDDDGRLLDTLDDSFGGAVIGALGGGHLSESMADRAAALARRMPVVLAARMTPGPVLTETYGYRGGEIDLIGRGLIPAGLYDAQRARLLLALALASGLDQDRIADILEDRAPAS